MEQLERIRSDFSSRIKSCKSLRELENLRVEFLGKKGRLTLLLRSIPELPIEKRKPFGKRCNEIKRDIEDEIKKTKAVLRGKEVEKNLKTQAIDITAPGKAYPLGATHIITRTLGEILEIFSTMGFSVVEGPEIETEFNNFEALNMPKGHPAREMQDTFYLENGSVLRTHTSPVQIRLMKSHKPPIQAVTGGKVYRRDADITHTPMFHQVEGLMVDTKVTFSDLKGILELFLKRMFGEGTKVRFRPSFFPFTEPSAEVDIGCVMCGGKGCNVCKGTGWLEILGCGMVDPYVFKSAGVDTDTYQGFAFGMGVERIAMLKYGINDLRLFFENDLRFLRQFGGI